MQNLTLTIGLRLKPSPCNTTRYTVPMEINLQFVRIQRQNELPNMMFDDLFNLDEKYLFALETMICKKEKVAYFYNGKVKLKAFNQGDLVRKVILPMDKKSKSFGKW